MYKAAITVCDKDLLKLLALEDGWDSDRSSLTINKGIINIEAKDIIAFKATVNGLIKLIEAYEKASISIK